MKKHSLQLLIMLIISFAPFLWGYGLNTYKFIGAGDFLSIINIQRYFDNVFYVFDQNSLAGADLSYLGAHVIPLYLFFRFFSLWQVTPLIVTLLFISFILFVSQACMYFFVEYVLERKVLFPVRQRSGLSLFAGILYGFSPYIVGLISPGHILLLIAYAFFPLILKTYDQLITARALDFRHWFYLFLLFLVCATSFANVGSPAGILVALLAYSVFSYLFAGIGWKRLSSRFVLTGFTIYLANAWWLTPYLLSIRKTIALNEASGGIPGSFGEAAIKASVGNILFGRAEYLMYIIPEFGKYVSTPMTVIFSVFIVLLGLTTILLRKNRYVLLILGMLLFGIYVTKTDQLPFYEPYKYMYEHLQIFQIFRRPVSKFYWLPLFFYFTAITVGLGYIIQVLWKRFRVIGQVTLATMLVFAFYWAYLFARTPLLSPFNIPNYYYRALDVFSVEQAQRIAILPSTLGFHPAFNESSQGFSGIDFLWYIWPYSVLYPDSSSYSPALLFKPLGASLLSGIRSNSTICELTKQLDISHLVVRQDLSETMKLENNPKDLIEILRSHKDIISEKTFGTGDKPGFTLFTLKPECRSSLIQLIGDEEAQIAYQKVSPVELRIRISHLSGSARLQYLTNLTKLWELYPTKWLAQYLILFKKAPLSDYHSSVYSYANAWELSPNVIKRSFTPDQYSINSDGTINVDLTLYYSPQILYYQGGILTGSVLFGSLGYILFKRKKAKTTP